MTNLKDLVERLEKYGFVKREEVKEAFLKVDRKIFVPKEYEHLSYEDIALPLIKDSTISAPHMHAIYLEELELKEKDKFLEIGFGSGILLAYAYEITKTEVYGIEIDKDVFEIGKRNLEKSGYLNKCKLFLRDGKFGLKEFAPFDKIYESWIDQLNNNGILLVPIVEGNFQKLYKIKKVGNKIEKKFICDVMFVNLK